MKKETEFFGENFTQDMIKSGSLKSLIESYDDPWDMSCSPRRIKFSTYSPKECNPIIFRHYDHILDDDKGFSAPEKMCPDYYTMFVFVEHNTRMMINDNGYIPKFGSVVMIGRNDMYQPIFLMRDRIEYYEINFPEDFFKHINDLSPFHELFLSEKKHSIISPTHEAAEKMFHILRKIDRLLEGKSSHASFLIYSHLISFASYICDILADKDKMSGNQTITRALNKAIDYISSNYLTINGIQEIADHCQVSLSYLCRIFKKQLNTTPIEFINLRKIHHAKYMLKKGYNVTDACYASGFNNYTYFISTFKKLTGQTPMSYKKSESESE